jgi:hypothetical protein
MGIKSEFEKAVDKTKDAVANVRDAANEATHRRSTDAEAAKRDVAGNDAVKREVRNNN